MNNKTLVFLTVVTFLFGALLSYILSPKKVHSVYVDNSKAKIDSIYNRQIEKDKESTKRVTQLSKQVDSLKNENNSAKAELKKERKKVLLLADEVKEAYAIYDTSSYYKYCNELSAEVKILDNTIENFENLTDSLLGRNDALNNLLSVQAKEWRLTSNSLQQQATKQAYIIDSLATVNVKLARRKNKRFTVGLGACGGLTNTGYGGAVGVVVSKTVFSF